MPTENYLAQLNEAQRAAVEYLDGPELVVAGAGSGKTRVITYKIVHLLANGHKPGRIMALTFTNKAASEMRERIGKLAGEEVASRLWMGTFHSIFSRILRRHADRIGFSSNFTIYDTADSKSLIKTIIRELKLDDKIYRPGLILSDISWVKNQLVTPEDYIKDKDLLENDARNHRERTAEIYRTYRDRCRIAGAMDFDDLLLYTNILLRDNPDILEMYRGFFSYILVDEYQDTNFAQHAIVRQLCHGLGNLCVVGDDAQSIYSFRGANIRNILDLSKSFPNLRIYKLEENYRSTQNIIGAANSLIAFNEEQIHKEVFSNNEIGDPIEVIQAYNDYDEASTVAAQLLQIRRRFGLKLNDIAILYRTNAQSRILEEMLRGHNIAYLVYGGLAFYQRKEIKDALAYFRLSVNPYDDEALVRIINTPKRGIGKTTIEKLQATAVKEGTNIYDVISNPDKYCLDVNKGTRSKLADFAKLIDGFRVKALDDIDASQLANHIIETTGLMKEYLSESTPENISKQENLAELLKGVSDFVDRNSNTPKNTGLANFLAEVSLLTDQDTDKHTDDCVTMMTMHSAKGLEFGAVFIVGAEECLIPSDKCHTQSAIEEERRLMYVAITRAKRYCQISYARMRMINGKTNIVAPSRFISDIAPRYLRMMTGTKLPKRNTSYGVDTNINRQSASTSHPQTIKPEPVKVSVTIGGANKTNTPNTLFTLHRTDELSVGMEITHSVYGYGKITDIQLNETGDRIIVAFKDGNSRTLLLKFARFTINK